MGCGSSTLPASVTSDESFGNNDVHPNKNTQSGEKGLRD